MFKARLASVHNKSVKDRSFYDDRRDPKYLDPQGKLINSRKFSDYFDQLRTEKQKKLLVKNKELLFKSDEIEFGCMSKRHQETLIITFYITPVSGDLNGLVSRLLPKDDNLDLVIEPKNVAFIRKGKQEKVTIIVTVKNLPYLLP